MIYQSSITVHDAARVQRQRIQKMPLRQNRARSETAASLAAIAWVGAYAGGGVSFVVVALVMSAVCVTQFVLSRRPM